MGCYKLGAARATIPIPHARAAAHSIIASQQRTACPNRPLSVLGGMCYVIEKPDGAPLTDADGRQHLFTSLAEARKWVMDGERVCASVQKNGNKSQD